MNTKILKIVLLGNVILHTPFIIAIIISFNFINELYKIKFLLVSIFLGFIYWSIFTPFYKIYSIKKLKNVQEYEKWKKLSINTLLFWSDKNFFTKFEKWNSEKLNNYKSLKTNLSNHV